MTFFIYIFLFFGLTGMCSWAQSTDSSGVDVVRKERNFLENLGNDFVVQAQAPFTMNSSQTLWFGAGTLATAGLIAIDEDIDRTMRHLPDDYPWVHSLSSGITEFGGSHGVLAGLAFGAYSIALGDSYDQTTALMLAEAFITSGVWARLGKFLAGRERPSAAYESHISGGKWHGPSFEQFSKKHHRSVASFDAFPSGHTATVFSLATVFAERYGKTPIVPILAYSTATLVGLSRMTEHTHWASDVFVGAALGYFCAQQITSREKTPSSKSSAVLPSKRFETAFYADFSGGYPSLCFVAKF